MESVSRKRGYQQLPVPDSARRESSWRWTFCIRIHQVVHLSCDNKMVELQRTLCFDELVLCLLKEREKYSGKLTEEKYGIAL